MKATTGSTQSGQDGMKQLRMAMALVLGLATLPTLAQTAGAEDRLCTAGFNDQYGWFDVDPSGLGVLDFPPGTLWPANCVDVTPAKLAIQFGGLKLPLAEPPIYDLTETPPTLRVSLLEPALCEDYNEAAPAGSWNLHISDAADVAMLAPVKGVNSLDYILSGSVLVPVGNDQARCYSGLAENPPLPPDPEGEELGLPFGDGFEPLRPDIQIAFFDMQGSRLDDGVLTQGPGADVQFKVRVKNIGKKAASDVRIAEFVPTNTMLLMPFVTRVDCTDDDNGGATCSGSSPDSDGIGSNRFRQNIGTLAAGASRTFTLTRRSSNSSNFSPDQPMSLIQVAAFSDSGISGADTDADYANNSRSLRIRAVDNFPPVADPKTVTTEEDTAVSILLSGSDPEGDSLTFQVGSGPSHGTLTGILPNLTYTPGADYFGSDSFTYTANDGITSSAPATVSITITPVDDGPRVATPLPNVEYDEGDNDVWIELGNAFTDPEGDSFTLSLSGDALPGGLAYNSTGRVIFNAAPLSNTSDGVYSITVTATNAGTPPTASQTFTITVHNVNQNPTVSSTPLQDRTDDEGDPVSFSVAAAFEDSDPDDVLVFSVTGGSLPPGISLATNGAVSGTLDQTAAENSPYTITITADDQQGGTVSDSFDWTVNAVNVAPEATGTLGDKLAFIGTALTVYTEAELLAVFTDVDGDPLEITVGGLPDGVIYEEGVRIYGSPEVGTEGLYTITIRATDPSSEYDETTFHLGVY